MRAESKGDTQKLNSLRNTLRRDWHTETVWCDAQSVYSLRVDPDVLRPIPNFTRNEVYRESLAELDALQAKVDELQARFDDFEGDCYRGATVVQWYEHSVLLQGKLDEMERTHMLLPVDADGVPIRIGDLLEHVDIDGYEERFTVMGYTRMPDSVTFMATNGVSAEFYCDQCRHVQQDTVESLLEEFQQDTLTTQGEYAGEVIDADKWKRDLKEHIEDYAERIRKVVKQ
ncbi:MAG: hypothetical protein IJ586_08535 [Alloprevotella sp.]|nr:hypothetical protein [Alloprevotella sp.]MBR1447108.1 hypothetical protein [Alloprevotella sp.]